MARSSIIAIGASAGGVAALRSLAAALPRTLSAPVLAVLHIGAYRSELPALLNAAGLVPAKQDIQNLLTEYEGRTVPVYAEAENIRQRWISENVALEDIVDQIMRGAHTHSIGLEIDPAQAADALRGPL